MDKVEMDFMCWMCGELITDEHGGSLLAIAMKPWEIDVDPDGTTPYVWIHADEKDQAARIMDVAYMALMSGARRLGVFVEPTIPIPN